MVNREEMYEFLVEFPDRLKDDTDDDLQDLKKENHAIKQRLYAAEVQHEVDAAAIVKLNEELIKVKDCFREHAEQAVSHVALISKLKARVAETEAMLIKTRDVFKEFLLSTGN